MKLLNRLILVLIIGFVITSCKDEDTFPYDQDEVLSNSGAFVRVDNVISGEFDLNNFSSSSFQVELTEWDVEDGALLQNLVLTVEFVDNTPENGTNNVAATTIETYVPSDFSTDPETGLPNIIVNIPATDALNTVGLTESDLDGGDVFRFEWTLNLTNGKSFNRTNSSASFPSWPFYNSPFLLDVGVVCLLPDGFATGSYAMTQTEGNSDPFFGEPTTFYEGDVTLAVGATSTERTFGFPWLGFPSTMAFNLVCGNTEVSANASAGASCGGGIVWFTGDGSGKGTFDPQDDGTITIRFWDDYTNDCGLTAITELTLIKN